MQKCRSLNATSATHIDNAFQSAFHHRIIASQNMLEPISVLYTHYGFKLNPSTSQLVEHLLVQRLIRLLRAHR